MFEVLGAVIVLLFGSVLRVVAAVIDAPFRLMRALFWRR